MMYVGFHSLQFSSRLCARRVSSSRSELPQSWAVRPRSCWAPCAGEPGKGMGLGGVGAGAAGWEEFVGLNRFEGWLKECWRFPVGSFAEWKNAAGDFNPWQWLGECDSAEALQSTPGSELALGSTRPNLHAPYSHLVEYWFLMASLLVDIPTSLGNLQFKLLHHQFFFPTKKTLNFGLFWGIPVSPHIQTPIFSTSTA